VRPLSKVRLVANAQCDRRDHAYNIDLISKKQVANRKTNKGNPDASHLWIVLAAAECKMTGHKTQNRADEWNENAIAGGKQRVNSQNWNTLSWNWIDASQSPRHGEQEEIGQSEIYWKDDKD